MSFEQRDTADDIAAPIERLAACDAAQPNCMIRLAPMVARIATEPSL